MFLVIKRAGVDGTHGFVVRCQSYSPDQRDCTAFKKTRNSCQVGRVVEGAHANDNAICRRVCTST